MYDDQYYSAECVGNLAEDKFPKETDGLTETGKEQVNLLVQILLLELLRDYLHEKCILGLLTSLGKND